MKDVIESFSKGWKKIKKESKNIICKIYKNKK